LDVFEDEVNHLAEEFGDVEMTWKLVEDAHRRGQRWCDFTYHQRLDGKKYARKPLALASILLM
jgi:hypothetical protein